MNKIFNDISYETKYDGMVVESLTKAKVICLQQYIIHGGRFIIRDDEINATFGIEQKY